jgi:hypothetical protein
VLHLRQPPQPSAQTPEFLPPSSSPWSVPARPSANTR